jgi:hypothetical protein
MAWMKSARSNATTRVGRLSARLAHQPFASLLPRSAPAPHAAVFEAGDVVTHRFTTQGNNTGREGALARLFQQYALLFG